jgi:phosphatidylethanolamine-binding protein (PEBP) family uncharacterized protein
MQRGWQAMYKKMLNLAMLVVFSLNMLACGSMPRSAATDIHKMSAGNSSVSSDARTISSAKGFALSSPEVVEGGALPSEYTCDGASATLPLAWSGAPAGTKGFAVIMHHVAGPGDTHWYWVLYDIPADVTNLSKNSVGIGTLGTNSVNGKAAYTPPCSKGPGE